MKIFMFLSIMMTMVSAIFVFRIKHEVVNLENTINAVRHDIRTTQEEINVLSSEIFLLTTPKRIEKLRKIHLKDFQRLQRDQLISPETPNS